MFVDYYPLIGSFLVFVGVAYQARKVFKGVEVQLARQALVDNSDSDNKRIDQFQEDLEREQSRSEILLDRINKMDVQLNLFRDAVDQTSTENRRLKYKVDQVLEENKKLRVTLQVGMNFIKRQQDQAIQAGIVPLELPELLRSI